MSDVSIKETFTLPSKGKLYGQEFNPKITLRSMVTMDELKRNSKYDTEFKVMSDVIEDCIEEKLPVHVYDMCIGDYQFLLHKLRLVTYGSEYNMYIQCPNCGKIVESKVQLDTLEVLEFDEEEVGKCREITLPVSGKKVLLSFQTPRMLDNIKEKSKELERKNKDVLAMDYELLFTAMSFIKEFDGRPMDEVRLEPIVRKLPLKDIKYLIQKGDELNSKVGLDTSVIAKCPKCGYETVTTFLFGPQFWNPTFDN